jgi:hypothetical protein
MAIICDYKTPNHAFNPDAQKRRCARLWNDG